MEEKLTEKTLKVLPEWIDENGHMNVAYYVLAFDIATDEIYESWGFGRAYSEKYNYFGPDFQSGDNYGICFIYPYVIWYYFIKYYSTVTIFTLIGKFFFSKSYKENNYLIIILSLIILMLNEILPNYPWFVRQIIDITAQQTDKSIGLTLFLYEKVLDGLYILIFPIKIASSLFAGIFKKPIIASYESIFNYFSQIIFFTLSINIIYNLFKKKYSEFFILFFIGTVFLIIFSLPPISQHRYIFFLYQLFVLLVCLDKSKYKRMDYL